MKTTKQNTLAAFALGALISIGGCTQNAETAKKNSEDETKTEVPTTDIKPLLGRSGRVGSQLETDKMFRVYNDLKTAIDQNPDDYAARLKMADLYIVEARATGNYGYYYPAAMEMIDGVLEDNPEDKEDKFRALTSKAVILLSYHKFEEAKEMGEKAVAVNPYNSRVYGILTDANVELGNYEEAVKMADSMVSIRPDLRSYSRISYLREIYGEVDGAKEAMKLAVQAGAPGHEETVWSLTTLGNLYENYGDLKMAEQQYAQALQTRKAYPFAMMGLARVEMKRGNLQRSEELMKEAIDIRAEAGFYEDLAMLYSKMDNREKDWKSARDQAFATLQGLAGDGAHSHGDMEGGHSHSGHDDHSHESENEHGHSHEVGLEMANLYLKLDGNYKEALHHALHEYANRPDNIEVNKALAEIYLMDGKTKQAQEHYEKATITGSKDPELMMIGALIQKEMGNTAEAGKMMAGAKTANPYLREFKMMNS